MAVVLVVDDDKDVREVMVDLLSDAGYHVFEAVDGQAALELLSTMSEPPRVVLLDMMMPRMNGNEFMRAVAAVPALASIPIVVVSAYPGTVDSAARRVLRKPFNLDTLLGAVHEFCLPA